MPARSKRTASDPRTVEPEPLESPEASEHDLPTLREILPNPVDWKFVHVMVLSCVVLIVCRYFGNYRGTARQVNGVLVTLQLDQPNKRIERLNGATSNEQASITVRTLAAVERRLDAVFNKHPRARLWQLYYWVVVHALAYLVLPMIVIKWVLREQISDYGLKISGWYRKAWIYAVAMLLMVPLVLLFGSTEGFKQQYPFYKAAGNSWADLLGWELAYAFQFFALEFFFRGVMINGLRHRFGWYAVLIMTLPYVMIHFGKPLPETAGAIIAGLFLGTMALWTRSIWLGTFLHIGVAWSMDLMALYHKGQLSKLFD